MALDQRQRALHTDLYELTMAAAYFDAELTQPAAFEMFVRSLPEQRSYLVCAGLEQIVSYLRELRFEAAQIDYLRGLPAFARCSPDFFDYLAGFAFSGSLHAIPEGTPVFAGEPLLRVQAPIIEAQIVETFLLSVANYETLVATKAARIVEAARADGKNRTVVDFGTRRAHGPDAGVLAARAAFIGGCVATSNVEAGFRMGIPVSGTEAHSYVMAFDTEEEAFAHYYRCFREDSVLLIDTYDTVEGARIAARVAPRMRGVRIDSGDIVELSRQARTVLDEAGREDAIIVASGDLDEYAIRDLVAGGAPVDAFGVGTKLVTSEDAASLQGVYKLVALRKSGVWEPRLKLSADKATLPGLKQVHRYTRGEGSPFARDVIAAAEEDCPAAAAPLLTPVMLDGRVVAPTPDLPEIRRHAAAQIARLPAECRRLDHPAPYPVEVSPVLQQRFRKLADEREE